MGTATLHAAFGLLLSLYTATGGGAAGQRAVRENVPDDPRAALARGLALVEERPEAAVVLLRAARGTPVDDLTRFALARALIATDHAAEAVPLLEAVRHDPLSPWRPDAARLHPVALRAAGNLRPALRSYGTLLDRYAELPDRATVLWEKAEVEAALRQKVAAAATLAELVWSHPDAAEAPAAAARLAALRAERVRVPEPTFGRYLDRAARYRLNRRFDRAHADLDAAAALAGSSAARQQVVFGARLATWQRAMDWPALITALEPAVGAQPEKSPERARLLSLALRRSGRVDDGLALLERLAHKHAGVSARDVANTYLEEGRVAEADRRLEPLLRRARHNPPRSFDAAWLEYRTGHLDAAIAGFDATARRRSGSAAQRARYWHGRALMDAGRADEAAAAFAEVIAADPADYYAYLARSRLLDLGRPDPEYAGVPERLAGSNAGRRGLIAPAKAALCDVPGREALPPDTLARLAERHGARFPRLPRAALLLELGRKEDARRELRLLLAEIDHVQRNPRNVSRLVGRPISYFLDRRETPRGVRGEDLDDPALVRKLRSAEHKAERARLASLRRLPRETVGDLRDAFRVVGDPWGVRRMTHKLDWYSKGLPCAENRDFYRDTNPLAWREAVQREAQAEGLDPALVWAVMTVESAYNETAHSVANARGLLQLLPRTAWLVARDRGEPPPHPTELLDPERNVRYGVWYLARLVERFQGQELLAAAAYNAGPHNIAWRIAATADQPFDVVLEDLPADLGREYAKKVLEFVGHYRRVYLDDAAVYVGQQAQPPVDGINY